MALRANGAVGPEQEKMVSCAINRGGVCGAHVSIEGLGGLIRKFKIEEVLRRRLGGNVLNEGDNLGVRAWVGSVPE